MKISYKLSDLVEILVKNGLNASCKGDANFSVQMVSTLQEATSHDLTFLHNQRYHRYLATTKAGAILVSEEDCKFWNKPAITVQSKDLHVAWAYIVRLFDNAPKVKMGIHPSAIIADTAQISEEVSIGAYCVIGEHVKIAKGCVIGSHSIIEDYVQLGEACFLYPRATILHHCELGARVVVHSGAIIGSDGFGFAPSAQCYVKVAQLGRVVIHDNADIGANTTIDRGALRDTIIGKGVKLDNQIQVAHNVEIGENTVSASGTGISGSTKIGKNCMIGGGVGFAGHIEIADNVVFTGFTMVTHSINQAGVYSSGLPIMPNKEWHHLVARLKRIEKLYDRVNELEKNDKEGDLPE